MTVAIQFIDEDLSIQEDDIQLEVLGLEDLTSNLAINTFAASKRAKD